MWISSTQRCWRLQGSGATSQKTVQWGCGHPEAPRRHPGSTQETARRHPPKVFPPSPKGFKTKSLTRCFTKVWYLVCIETLCWNPLRYRFVHVFAPFWYPLGSLWSRCDITSYLLSIHVHVLVLKMVFRPNKWKFHEFIMKIVLWRSDIFDDFPVSTQKSSTSK